MVKYSTGHINIRLSAFLGVKTHSKLLAWLAGTLTSLIGWLRHEKLPFKLPKYTLKCPLWSKTWVEVPAWLASNTNLSICLVKTLQTVFLGVETCQSTLLVAKAIHLRAFLVGSYTKLPHWLVTR